MRNAVFYFTGTGNTEFVARELRAAFGPEHPTELFNIEFLPEQPSAELFAPFDLLIFGAPVIAFNPPKYFVQFLRRLPEGKGRRAALFLNAGGERWADIGYASAILRRRGYNVTSELFFLTVGNMLLRAQNDDTGELYFVLLGWKFRQDSRGLFAQCQAEVRDFARQLLAGVHHRLRPSPIAQALQTLTRWLFYSLACPTFKWCVHAQRDCTFCGICVKACPTANIRLDGKRLGFGTACTVCYRCLNVCPKQAIRFRWPMGQFGNDVPYLAPGWKPPLHNERQTVHHTGPTMDRT